MLNYYQITVRSHLLTGLSATALCPAAPLPNTSAEDHNLLPSHRRASAWQQGQAPQHGHGEAVLSSPAARAPCPAQREDTKGGHMSLSKTILCFSLFTRKRQCLPTLCSQKLPETQDKSAGNAKTHHNHPRHFHKGLLTSSQVTLMLSKAIYIRKNLQILFWI